MTAPNPRPNPYVGPRSYKRGETLYGRDRELQQLLDLLIAERIILLHSPSGAGKSSLIQAGLVHRLVEDGFSVLPVIRVHLESPIDLGQIECANRYVFSALLSLEENLPAAKQTPLEKLAGMSMEDYLAQRPKEPEEPDSQVVIFDQFEEILTLDPTGREGRVDFFAQIGAVLRDRRRWALFAIREDYLAGLEPYLRPIPTRLANTFRLDLLGYESALQAIQLPAQHAGVEFTAEAARKLVDDLRRIQVQQPDGSFESQEGLYVEPVQLQVVCFRLWQNLSAEAAQITLQDLAAVGDVNQSLAEYYSERVHAAAQETEVGERTIRRWFDEQLITERGIRSQVLLEKEQSAGLKNSAIWFLEGAHLVRGEKRRGVTWFELAHDRLIEPVRQNNAAWELANLSLLQRQALLWEREERPAHLLLRDQALEDAKSWVNTQVDPLTPVEQDFLEASAMAQQHAHEQAMRAEQAVKLEAAEKLADAEKRRAEEQARAAGRLRRRALYLGIALFLATLMTLLAGFSLRQAIQNRDLADQNLDKANLALIEVAAQRETAEAASDLFLAQKSTAEAALESFKTQVAISNAANLQVIQVAQQASGQVDNGGYKEQVDQAVSRSLASLALNSLYDDPQRALLLAVEAYNATDTEEARSALLKILQSVRGQGGTTAANALLQQDQPIVQLAFEPAGNSLIAASSGGALYHLDISGQQGAQTLANLPAAPVSLWAASSDQIRASTVARLPDAQPAGQALQGIDINPGNSQNQNIDWQLARQEAGIEFAYIRVTEGTNPPLQQFDSSRQGAKEAKILTGAYHYFSPSQDPEEQAKNFLGSLSDLGDLPPALYLEQTEGRSPAEISQKVGVWLQSVEAGSGVRPIVYLPIWFWNDYISKAPSRTREWAGKYSLWAATQSGSLRPTLPTPWSQWTILQTLTKVRVKGIPGTVNMDKLDRSLLPQSASPRAESETPQLWHIEKERVFNDPVFVEAIKDGSLPLAAAGPASIRPGGDLLAWAAADGGVAIWQIDGQYLAANLNHLGETDPVTALAFSPDGSLLAVGTLNGNLATYDLNLALKVGSADPASTSQPFGPTPITALAFSPDGKMLALGGGCKEAGQDSRCTQAVPLLILDFPSQKPLFSVMTGHQLGVSSLAFRPDEKTLASGSEDHTIILWDTSTGQPIGDPLAGHTAAVTALTFASDGSFLASGGQDGQVLLWSLESRALAQQACDIAKRNLSEVEWKKYFPDQPYRKTCPNIPGPEPKIPLPPVLTPVLPAPQTAP